MIYTFKQGEEKPATTEDLETVGIDSTSVDDFHFSKIEIYGDNCKKIRDRILYLLDTYGVED